MRLELPGVLSLAFGWWSFEISTLVAGSVDTTQLTISSTVLQIVAIYFMVSVETGVKRIDRLSYCL